MLANQPSDHPLIIFKSTAVGTEYFGFYQCPCIHYFTISHTYATNPFSSQRITYQCFVTKTHKVPFGIVGRHTKPSLTHSRPF